MKPFTAAALAVTLLCASLHAPAQGNAIFLKPFAAITGAATSNPLANIGQTQHLIVVTFPDETGAVASLQVRIEGSFDNTAWFAISADITQANLVGGVVYNMAAGYGAFPYIRVRSLNATPGGEELHCWYSGAVVPIQTVVKEQSDRYIL